MRRDRAGMAIHEGMRAGDATDGPARDIGHFQRHRLADRLFHWVNAASVLTLMGHRLRPGSGLEIRLGYDHWLAGIVLTLAVIYHFVRAIVALDTWLMLPVIKDLKNAWRSMLLVLCRRHQAPGKPDKCPLMQKLYHWGMAGGFVVLIATGLVMLAKLDTPFWQ